MSALVREFKLETVTRGQLIWMAIFAVVGLSWANTTWEIAPELGFVMFLIGGGIGIGVLLLASWAKTFTAVQVFEDRVEVVNRFLVKNSRRIEASKIESVDYSQSLLGRSRYGSLVVRGAGTQAITVIPVKDPEGAAEAIRGIADKSISKAAPQPQTSGLADTQSLAELIQMRESGHLTEEEFSAAKKKILGD